jgi:hypothetical protein
MTIEIQKVSLEVDTWKSGNPRSGEVTITSTSSTLKVKLGDKETRKLMAMISKHVLEVSTDMGKAFIEEISIAALTGDKEVTLRAVE